MTQPAKYTKALPGPNHVASASTRGVAVPIYHITPTLQWEGLLQRGCGDRRAACLPQLSLAVRKYGLGH